MREFSSEEIEHYNAFHEHGSGFEKQTFDDDDDDGGGGIQRLTSSFVIGLQVFDNKISIPKKIVWSCASETKGTNLPHFKGGGRRSAANLAVLSHSKLLKGMNNE